MKNFMKKATALFLAFVMLVVLNGAAETVENKTVSYAATTEDIRLKGIDVSHHQGAIDWKAVKEDGIDFAIIRCGYGQDLTSQDDAYWKENADGCTKYGIPFGTYLYSYATTPEGAIGEAKHVLRLIKGYNLQYPIYYDIEHASQKKLTAKQLAAMAAAFVETIEDAGYEAGIYSGYNWFVGYLTEPDFDNWDRWVARYNTYCGYNRDYNMWQYSSTGTVNGINGDVDLDYLVGTEVAAEVRGVSLNETKKVMNKGDSYKLEYSVAPLNAFEKNVVWSSNKEDVATVAKDGTVTAVGAGSATITVSSVEDSEMKATCDVTVKWEVEVTKQPDTSTGPAITKEPEVSTGPAVTKEPDASTEPAATKEPEVSTGPAVTREPDASTEPAATKEPEISAEPAITDYPHTSEEPGAKTPVPEPTATPEVTPTFTVSAIPKITDTPKPTETPEPTAKPTATPTAKPDATPTATPKVTVGKSKSVSYQAVTKNQVKVSWKKVSGADGYRLYYCNTSTKKDVLIAKIAASQTSYTVTKVEKKVLKPGTKYTFKLAAYKTVENKNYLGEKVTVNTITKPETVKIKTAKRTSNTKAILTWKPVGSAKGYVIYISTSKTGTYRALATVAGSKKKTYTISGLKKGKIYYVRVCAYQKLGNATWYGNYYATKTISKK